MEHRGTAARGGARPLPTTRDRPPRTTHHQRKATPTHHQDGAAPMKEGESMQDDFLLGIEAANGGDVQLPPAFGTGPSGTPLVLSHPPLAKREDGWHT